MTLFVPHLKARGHLENLHIIVGIVGSRKILQDDDYGSKGWSALGQHLTIYGFDADEEACDAANAELARRNITWQEKHIPLALASTVGEATLYVTGHPACSSLYPPNEPLISRFNGFEHSMKPNFTIEIETTTIDEFCARENVQFDFLQVDVQGADLDVLKGASEVLKNYLLGVLVEVEFIPLYHQQPLFTDIDLFLRNHNLTLFDLITDNPWCRVTRSCSPFRAATRAGQLTWADACYLRDPLQHQFTEIQSPAQILKIACLADALEFPDYTLELLGYLTITYGNDPVYNFASVIVEVLSQFPDLVNQGVDALPIMAAIRDRL
ncbi:MAG: FkbM family methyltransferase [Plectolyngbya sp. WJT66-NPBG17]|jgi:FkbM family methyltransferase|nr:FkbM family methyltransferase [Plectolyngbya sp. WJT66-NPBG17]